MSLYDVVKAALDDAEIHYSNPRDHVFRAGFQDVDVIISVDEERSCIQYYGNCSVNMPEAKRAQAIELVNQLNADKVVKYVLDSDGDLRVEWYVDTDEGHVGHKLVMLSLTRVLRGAEEGFEPLMKLRFS